MRVRIRPTEAINFGAIAVLAAMTLLLYDRLAAPGRMFLRYAVLAGILLLIVRVVRREDRLPSWLQFLTDFYPAAFVPILFNTLEPLILAVRGGTRDDLLIAADRRIFGVDVTVWLQRFVHPFLNDVFFVFYATYYFIALSLALVLWLKDRPAMRRYVFTLMVCYYVSYAGYFTIPAVGPRFAQADAYTVSLTTTPVSQTISDTINRLEKTKCDVFPSGHTMISVAVLLVAWKRSRRTFWYLLPVATGLIIATVYCRYHYVIDLIAGTALASVSVPVGDAIYDRLLADSRRAAFEPRASVG
jgi:membrane-associated phospholipid phosphatase